MIEKPGTWAFLTYKVRLMSLQRSLKKKKKSLKHLCLCLPVAQFSRKELLALGSNMHVPGIVGFHSLWALVPEEKVDNPERDVTVGMSLFTFLIETN